MEEEARKTGLSACTDWWRTEIIDIAPGIIRIRGYAIEDLIGTVSFPAMIWLMLRGELPDKAQAELFGAMLVSAVDHGPQSPAIAIARMAMSCGIGINGAMASGINALGDVHGGAGEQCMELIADIAVTEDVLTDAVYKGLARFRAARGKFIPGFGHRFHPIDPRAVRLAALLRAAADRDVVSGRYLAIGEAIAQALAREGKHLPLNIDGITAIMLLELGFPPALGRGIFILSRSVGICAHAFEQSRTGERIKGPVPPEAGFRYSGAPPRKIPPGRET